LHSLLQRIPPLLYHLLDSPHWPTSRSTLRRKMIFTFYNNCTSYYKLRIFFYHVFCHRNCNLISHTSDLSLVLDIYFCTTYV
jgi:hypothetical protein